MRSARPKQSRSGFTLIELLVVITIIGILSTIGLTLYSGVKARARDAQRLDDARKIVIALEQFKSGSNRYPYLNSLGTAVCQSTTWCDSIQTQPWIPEIDRTSFIDSKIPLDPINTTTGSLVYKYTTNASGSDYCLEIPQEQNASSHPYFKTGTTWKLRFGPQGANTGLCNT